MSDAVECPYCGHAVDMSDCENYCRHTTYWGDDCSKPEECNECGKEFYIRERVQRTWHVGKTAMEAWDNYQ